MNQNVVLPNAGATARFSPIIELARLFPPEGARVLLKLETNGPTGSVKDRAVRSMLDSAQALGALSSGTRIVEATGGAEGLALASAAAMRGIPLTLFAPEGSYVNRIQTLQALGAVIEFTPKSKGVSGALRAVKALANAPEFWSPNLFENPANPGAHEATTGPEIWNASQGRVDAFVAGVGSGGTFMGVSRYLRRRNPSIELIAVEPKESPVLSGGKPAAHGVVGLGCGFVPPIFDRNLPNAIETVSTEEAAFWTRKLAQTEGLSVGISTGANLAVVARYASRRENNNKTVATVAFSSQLVDF